MVVTEPMSEFSIGRHPASAAAFADRGDHVLRLAAGQRLQAGPPATGSRFAEGPVGALNRNAHTYAPRMEKQKAPPGNPAGRRAVRSVRYNTRPTPDGESAAPALVK